MGGDMSATPLVEGAVLAADRLPCRIALVGKKHSLQRLLRHYKYKGDQIDIVPSGRAVKMGESPRESLQQKASSIAIAVNLVSQGEADGLVSVGNTGAALAHCIRNWRRLKQVKRPGIASLMPTQKKPCLIVDVGANVDCKPQHLVDFAIMGSIYAKHILGRQKPVIGMLSVGSEPSKGNSLTLDANALLEKTHLHFRGNVEPADVFDGEVDVLVCDGFVGNVFLKSAEALAHMLLKGVKGALTQNIVSLAGGLMVAPGMRRLKKKVDNSEYGGAPLLGLKHTCIIGHGSSSGKAVMNAIRVAHEAIEKNVNKRIEEEVISIAAEIKAQQAMTTPAKEIV